MEPLKYFCPRLVDYVAIVGNANPSIDSETAQQPEILRRYPPNDHEDFILPPDTAFFCQPEGCSTIGAKHMSQRDRQSFIFALTDKDSGRRRYGTCLNFYRPFKRKYKSLPQQTSLESTSSNEGGARSVHSMRVKALRSHTLTSLCLISHHALFDTFRECLNVLIKLIDVCNAAAYKKKCDKRRVRNLIWKYMLSSVTESADPTVLHWVKQIETWIYRLLSSPVPVPGKCYLQLHIVPESVGQPHILALPDQTRFSLVDFPLHLPLDLLGVEKCIQVLECIILEHKVLLMSRDYNVLSMTVLALVALIYPLEYMFPVIPLLPASLVNSEQLLYAPTPYIIGIPACFGQTRKTCLPNDVWLFDLDSDSVTVPPGLAGQLPPLPEPEGTMLRTHFKQSLASMSGSSQPVKNLDELVVKQQKGNKQAENLAAQQQGRSFNPFIYGNDIDSVDVATRVAMVRFFASPNILGNIQEHTRILRLYPRPVVGFQLASFIKSRPTKTLFICRLASTQAVEFYTEWSLSPSNLAFMRVQTGIYDPRQVGDKPRWYATNQHKMSYSACNNIDNSIFHLAEKSTDAPTDESGESNDEHFYPATSDSDADQSHDAKTSGQPITIAVDDIYRPPTELHRMDTLVAPSSSSESDSSDECNSSAEDNDPNQLLTYNNTANHRAAPARSSENSQAEKEVPPKPAPRRNPPPPKNAKGKTSSEGQQSTSPTGLISNLSSDLEGVAQSASSKLSELFDSVGGKFGSSQSKSSPARSKMSRTTSYSKDLGHQYNTGLDYHKTSTVSMSSPVSHPHKEKTQNEARNAVHGENQVFLKDTVAQVLEGHGVGWLKTGRIKRLMEDENYRNFVMSRLNTQLDNKLSDEDQVIGHVQVSRSVYKGVVALLNLITQGLEHTFKTNGCGGVASALMILEVASTHFYVKDTKSNNSSRGSSPFGSRESLVSAGKEGRSTPTQHKHSETGASQTASGSHNSAELNNDVDEDIMHQLVTNKSLIADRQYTVQDTSAEGDRRHGARLPISHQSLKVVATTSSSGKSSPTNSEAINNYSLTVTQNDATRKSAASTPVRSLGSDGKASLSHSSTSSEHSAARIYVFEGLLGKSRSQLWDQMQFWEDMFLDGVAQERDIIGLDQEPAALMDRYRLLGDPEKKHLELEEDKLLSTMLYNLTVFMIMMGTSKAEIRKKNRRLLGKSHIGLQCSYAINTLLDNVEKIDINDVNIRPVPSRTIQKLSFSVHWGSDNTGDMLFMEVCDDCILLRGVNGVIINRWWYERLVNMTCCPKTKVLCLWRKDGDKTQLNKFHTKKCKDLYNAIKEAMEKSASRSNQPVPGADLSVEFPVRDLETDKSGVLQVCMDGISLLLDKTKFFVELSRIKKCFTLTGGIFVIEELEETGVLKQRKFHTQVAKDICYAQLCVFSYVAAGTDQNCNIKEVT